MWSVLIAFLFLSFPFAATPTVQLSGKTITPAHFQLLRQQQQQAAQVQVPQIQAQAQAQSPAQIKTVGKLSQVSKHCCHCVVPYFSGLE